MYNVALVPIKIHHKFIIMFRHAYNFQHMYSDGAGWLRGEGGGGVGFHGHRPGRPFIASN